MVNNVNNYQYYRTIPVIIVIEMTLIIYLSINNRKDALWNRSSQ